MINFLFQLKNIDEQSKDEKESPKKRIIILKKFIIKKNTKLTEIVSFI